MSNECTAFREPATRVTGYATADVTGKRFVSITGDIRPDGALSVAHAAGRSIGVAYRDTKAGGQLLVIRNGTVPVLAAADLAAGVEVASDAQGRAIAASAGAARGYVETAATSGQDARVCLY